jgi:hypothetical protein
LEQLRSLSTKVLKIKNESPIKTYSQVAFVGGYERVFGIGIYLYLVPPKNSQRAPRVVWTKNSKKQTITHMTRIYF